MNSTNLEQIETDSQANPTDNQAVIESQAKKIADLKSLNNQLKQLVAECPYMYYHVQVVSLTKSHMKKQAYLV